MRREKEIEMRRVFHEQLNPAVLMPSPARSDSPVNFCSIDCPRNKQDQLMLHVGCEWWLFVGPYLTAGCPDCLPWGPKISSWSFRRAQVYLPKDSWGQGDTKGGFMEAKPARLVMGRQGKAREYPAAFKPLRHFSASNCKFQAPLLPFQMIQLIIWWKTSFFKPDHFKQEGFANWSSSINCTHLQL